MPRTSCEIEFSVIDTTAKSDGAVSVNAAQPISDAQDLTKDSISPPKIATLEDDYWTLDGTYDIYDPDNTSAEYGWWSNSMCGADRLFSTPPTLTIQFAANHTTMGITFKFGGDSWATAVNIKWYNAAGTIIDSADFTPDRPLYFCEKQVENFRKLVVSFSQMSKPHRYLKLNGIIYGQVLLFGADELTAASIQEEVNPISAEVSINTCDFTVHSKDDAFSIVNPSGIYRSMQQRQPIIVRETVNGIVKQMGTYYLNEWENTSDNVVTLKAVDSVGLLDALTFAGGRWTNVAASTIVAAIFAGCSVGYSLDPSYASVQLSGKLDACTKREALQQVAFVLGAIVETNRTSTVYIKPPNYTPIATIEKTRKWAEQKLTLRPLVTGVEVTTHSFDTSGNDTQTVAGYYATELPANTAPNIVQITDAMFVTTANASTIAQRVYAYYQNRYKNELTIKTEAEQAGRCVAVESYYGKTVTGMVESMEIDLVGGYISKIEVVGAVGA